MIFITACQPTPEEAIVLTKNQDKMLGKIGDAEEDDVKRYVFI